MFRNNGSIRINTLHDLRKTEQEPVRDELKGRHSVRISSSRKPLKFSGKEFHRMIPIIKVDEQKAEKVAVHIASGAQFNMELANAFVFCTSLKLDESLWRGFGYDAYYKITNPSEFAFILYEKLNQTVALIKCYKMDAVKYLDKPVIITNSNKERVLEDLEDPY